MRKCDCPNNLLLNFDYKRINESDTQAYRYGRAINNNDTIPLNQNVELLNFKDTDLSASKHSKLVWSDEMIKSYEKIKTLVANSPKLGIVQFQNPNPIILSTDASDHAFGFNIKQSQLDEKTDKFVDTYLFFVGKNLLDFFIHLKINHDLYQPYSAKILTKEALRWDTIFLFIQSVVFYTNVSCISLEHVMNPDALIG